MLYKTDFGAMKFEWTWKPPMTDVGGIAEASLLATSFSNKSVTFSRP